MKFQRGLAAQQSFILAPGRGPQAPELRPEAPPQAVRAPLPAPPEALQVAAWALRCAW